ncbi:low affinity immunoglobulin gamma Fc region receptor III-A isoform X1 [Ovis aries]|uniref:low affinity immunoglobulin gamma Fc region receptor III-A isoform X1 n=1 Tax=Ovis aries TaxID=9940 RepID=UPI0005FAF15C|nr:low affinity immunoglobulin gamma Fc region receptor III-A isoform X1 [Ovis aries]XP_060251529.1 low affinity immunoglobulin gamma Fc region receptor III-A isoform X1 [Ovis aries]
MGFSRQNIGVDCHFLLQRIFPTQGLKPDPSKAVVLLDPPWNRVLRNDHVTLKCQGDYPVEDNSTKWWHNGTRISSQTSSYIIADAKVEDSGKYECQTGLSALSDPVKLEVRVDWLLLQATKWVVNVGEPIQLKCHSWKKTPVVKVQYFQNGRGKKYFHRNSDFYIPEAKLEHSGSYFCRGIIGTKNESSESVQIIVQGLGTSQTISSFFPPWHQITFCLVMGLVFAVDTWLYFSVQRHLQNSEEWRNGKVTWSKGP